MDDQEASIKMAFVAGYRIVKGMPCDCLVKGDIQVWIENWDPKENMVQAMEVLEAWLDVDVNRNIVISGNKHIRGLHLRIRSTTIAAETGSEIDFIFNAFKKYLELKK